MYPNWDEGRRAVHDADSPTKTNLKLKHSIREHLTSVDDLLKVHLSRVHDLRVFCAFERSDLSAHILLISSDDLGFGRLKVRLNTL